MSVTVLGITGRAGSGKSTAAAACETAFDVEIIDLDKVGHLALEDAQIKKQLVTLFAKRILTRDGGVDRGILGPLVFGNSVAMSKLNRIVHPWMKAHVNSRVESASKSVILIVGSLIDEIGLLSLCRNIIVIDAEDTDISRILGTRVKILKSQKSRDSFIDMADVVVLNRFDPHFPSSLISEIKKILP
jgi:dephospho-CoA kinase